MSKEARQHARVPCLASHTACAKRFLHGWLDGLCGSTCMCAPVGCLGGDKGKEQTQRTAPIFCRAAPCTLAHGKRPLVCSCAPHPRWVPHGHVEEILCASDSRRLARSPFDRRPFRRRVRLARRASAALPKAPVARSAAERGKRTRHAMRGDRSSCALVLCCACPARDVVVLDMGGCEMNHGPLHSQRKADTLEKGRACAATQLARRRRAHRLRGQR